MLSNSSGMLAVVHIARKCRDNDGGCTTDDGAAGTDGKIR